MDSTKGFSDRHRFEDSDERCDENSRSKISTNVTEIERLVVELDEEGRCLDWRKTRSYVSYRFNKKKMKMEIRQDNCINLSTDR